MHVKRFLWLDSHKVDLLGSNTSRASHLHMNKGSIVDYRRRDSMEETGKSTCIRDYTVAIIPLTGIKAIQEHEMHRSSLNEVSQHLNGTLVRHI